MPLKAHSNRLLHSDYSQDLNFIILHYLLHSCFIILLNATDHDKGESIMPSQNYDILPPELNHNRGVSILPTYSEAYIHPPSSTRSR